MKLNRLAMFFLAATVTFAACEKTEEPTNKDPEEENGGNGNNNDPTPEKDQTPAELKSVVFYAADNAEYLQNDLVAEVADNMVVRIKDGGRGKTLVATLTAGENDEITVNDEKVGEDGKIEVDATFPIDIVVKNTKSEKTAFYELKVGKILGTVMTKVAYYRHADCYSMDGDFNLVINPANDDMMVVYDYKQEKAAKSNIIVAKFDNGTLVPVYNNIAGEITTNALPMSAIYAEDGGFYVLYKGGISGSTSKLVLAKLNGDKWDIVNPEYTQNVSTSFGNPYLFSQGNYVGFFSTGNVKTTTATYRQNAGFLFNGSSWSYPTLSIPGYGSIAGQASSGMFYVAVPVKTKDGVFIVTSSNLYGHYMFKFNDGSFEKVVDNFIPEGEEYAIPTNLNAVADPDGNIYLMSSHSKNPAHQLYKFDAANKTFVAYAGKIKATAASMGSVTEKIGIGCNPVTGQIVACRDNDETGVLEFSFIENGKWADWAVVEAGQQTLTKYDIKFDSKGNGYCLTADKADKSLILYKIGLEEDILPE